jgi:hypothetical protein
MLSGAKHLHLILAISASAVILQRLSYSSGRRRDGAYFNPPVEQTRPPADRRVAASGLVR